MHHFDKFPQSRNANTTDEQLVGSIASVPWSIVQAKGACAIGNAGFSTIFATWNRRLVNSARSERFDPLLTDLILASVMSLSGEHRDCQESEFNTLLSPVTCLFFVFVCFNQFFVNPPKFPGIK